MNTDWNAERQVGYDQGIADVQRLADEYAPTGHSEYATVHGFVAYVLEHLPVQSGGFAVAAAGRDSSRLVRDARTALDAFDRELDAQVDSGSLDYGRIAGSGSRLTSSLHRLLEAIDDMPMRRDRFMSDFDPED